MLKPPRDDDVGEAVEEEEITLGEQRLRRAIEPVNRPQTEGFEGLVEGARGRLAQTDAEHLGGSVVRVGRVCATGTDLRHPRDHLPRHAPASQPGDDPPGLLMVAKRQTQLAMEDRRPLLLVGPLFRQR